DEFVATGNRLGFGTAGQPLAVLYRELVLLGAGKNFRTIDLRNRLATSHGLASEIHVQLLNPPSDPSADAGELRFGLINSRHSQEFTADHAMLDQRRLQSDGTLLVLRHLDACCWLGRFGGSGRTVLTFAVLGRCILGTGFR